MKIKTSLLFIATLAAVGCAKMEASSNMKADAASPANNSANSLICQFYSEKWDDRISTNNKWVKEGKPVNLVIDLSKGYYADSPIQVGSSTMTLSVSSDASQGKTLHSYILMVRRSNAGSKVVGSFLELNGATSLQAQLVSDKAKSGIDCGSVVIDL